MTTRGKVLLVDDSQVVLGVARRALEAAGFAVATRDQPVGTTVALMREAADVVLMDVDMPLLEGHELVRSIKKRDTLRDIVVLLYSAKPANELREITRACGADGFILKATACDELVSEVSRWIDRRAKPVVAAP